jgi:hypothetical protein
MPEVPQQNEKNYLPARTGIGIVAGIFLYEFARANECIVRKGEGVLCAGCAGFLISEYAAPARQATAR